MLRFDVAYVLLTDLIITPALKAAIALNFSSNIIPMLDLGLRFELVAM